MNEHVELAKRIMHKGSGGVANFVLRWVQNWMGCCVAELAIWAGGLASRPAAALHLALSVISAAAGTRASMRACGGRTTLPDCAPHRLPSLICRSEIARRREAGTLPQPPPPAKGMSREQAAEALAVGASHPTWLVAGWLQQYGPKATMELLRWNNR